VRFEIEADIDHVRSCDCSICRRRGALIVRVDAAQFRLLSDWDALMTYRWGSGTATDYICKTCGILPFRKPSLPTAEETQAGMQPFHGWAVNARCLEDFDLDSVPVRKIHGSRLKI
jgi:hypothetical protein